MDMVNPLQLITTLLAIFCGGLGWWLVGLHTRHEVLRRDHEDLRVKIAGEYIRADQMRDILDDVKKDIHAMFSSLRDEIHILRNTK